MDDIRALEKRWYKYKTKKIMARLYKILLFGFLLIGIYFAYTKLENNIHLLLNKSPETNSSTEPLISNTPVVVDTNTTNNETVVAEKIESPESYEVSLEPVIPIIDIEKEERISSYKKPRTSHATSTASKGVKAKPATYLTANELAVIDNHALDSTKKKKINLNGTSVNYIETMKEKFARTKKPREALLLAKAFYASANYEEAEHWALTANKLDSGLEESWFIFAKSKVKLGKKDEAISILASYYTKSHSLKAKALIEKIKKGNL